MSRLGYTADERDGARDDLQCRRLQHSCWWPVPQALRLVQGGLDIHEFQMSVREGEVKKEQGELKCRHVIGTVYSDDISSLVHKRKMQEVLYELTRVSGTHHLRIHTGGTLQKPKAMLLKLYPVERKEEEQSWLLGGEPIADVPEVKLLGRICGRKIERSPSQIKAVTTGDADDGLAESVLRTIIRSPAEDGL
jgi:hypothetical protein